MGFAAITATRNVDIGMWLVAVEDTSLSTMWLPRVRVQLDGRSEARRVRVVPRRLVPQEGLRRARGQRVDQNWWEGDPLLQSRNPALRREEA